MFIVLQLLTIVMIILIITMISTIIMISWSNHEVWVWTRMPSPGATIHQHGKPGLYGPYYGLLYHTTCIVVYWPRNWLV